MADEPDNVTMLRSVAKAAQSGDQRELLLALRDRLAVAINDPKCSARDLAPLTRRLQEVSKDLHDLDVRAEAESKETTASDSWDPDAI